jgi:two-component system LytT family response regulator/two-component system response regulator LytT
VDDEPPAVDELKYILSQIKDIEVVASAGSASEAVTAIKESKPDVVFLDIHMPRHSGFYVAEKVSHFDPPPLIIFATAYDQYAVQAFEEGSLDYILKPFSEKRIQKALIRARNVLTSKRKIFDENDLKRLLNVIEGTKQSINRLPVEKKGHVLLMDPSDIFFFKAEEKKIQVHTRDDQFVCHTAYTLEELSKRLEPYSFFRTHRSYLVNLAHVREIIPWFAGRYLLKMRDKEATEIPVSRGHVKDFKQKLGI